MCVAFLFGFEGAMCDFIVLLVPFLFSLSFERERESERERGRERERERERS